jgi:hypothetical protein
MSFAPHRAFKNAPLPNKLAPIHPYSLFMWTNSVLDVCNWRFYMIASDFHQDEVPVRWQAEK